MKNLKLITASLFSVVILLSSCSNAHKDAIEEELSWSEFGDLTIEVEDLCIIEMKLMNSYSNDFLKALEFGDDIASEETLLEDAEESVDEWKDNVGSAELRVVRYLNDSYYSPEQINGVQAHLKRTKEILKEYTGRCKRHNNEIKSLTDSMNFYTRIMYDNKKTCFVYDVKHSFENHLTRSKAIKNTIVTVRELNNGRCIIIN